MATKEETLKEKIKSRLAVGALRFFSRFSLSTNHKIGTVIGHLLNAIPNDTKRITRINIALCFPHLTAEEQTQLVKEALLEAAKGTVEMAWFWHKPDEALAAVTEVMGADAMRTALAANEPVIILAPHLGAFEVLNFWVSKEFELHVMYKPSKIKVVDDLILAGREHFGATLYPTTPRGVAGLIRRLRKGGVITAILPDQVPESRSGTVFAPFYNHPAATGTMGPRMAQQSKARVFMGWAERLPEAGGYRIHLTAPDPDIYAEDLATAAAGMNRTIEQMINTAPAQYMWSYKRFRRETEGHVNPYKKHK